MHARLMVNFIIFVKGDIFLAVVQEKVSHFHVSLKGPISLKHYRWGWGAIFQLNSTSNYQYHAAYFRQKKHSNFLSLDSTGSSKINRAKFSDACSVRTNWLYMGWPFCLAEMRREFQTGGIFFAPHCTYCMFQQLSWLMSSSCSTLNHTPVCSTEYSNTNLWSLTNPLQWCSQLSFVYFHHR